MDLLEASVYHLRSLERLNRSPQTLKLYKMYQDSYLTWLLDHEQPLSLDALNPQFVREWQPWLRSRSHGRRGGVMTERAGVVSLKTWAHWLFENDVYPYDPLARLKVPRVPRLHRKPFTADEVQRLVQATGAGSNPIRDRALLLLLLDTGARIGEVCAATVADLDLARGTIVFQHTKNGYPRELVLRVPNARDGGPCMVALRNWLRIREARPGVETLFTSRDRLPLSTRAARELFAKLGQLARVPDVHPHRFRNTAASEFLGQRPGAELQLRSRLGHLSREQLDTYASISQQTAEEIAGAASLSTRWGLGGRSNGAPAPGDRNTRPSEGAPRFCTSCGRARGADDRFCSGCGQRSA